MMTYRISRNICIQHEEIFDLLVNYSTLHYIKILWIHNINFRAFPTQDIIVSARARTYRAKADVLQNTKRMLHKLQLQEFFIIKSE